MLGGKVVVIPVCTLVPVGEEASAEAECRSGDKAVQRFVQIGESVRITLLIRSSRSSGFKPEATPAGQTFQDCQGLGTVTVPRG